MAQAILIDARLVKAIESSMQTAISTARSRFAASSTATVVVFEDEFTTGTNTPADPKVTTIIRVRVELMSSETIAVWVRFRQSCTLLNATEPVSKLAPTFAEHVGGTLVRQGKRTFHLTVPAK